MNDNGFVRYTAALPGHARIKPIMERQFRSLSTYNYRLYFFGQMVSLVGTWMQTTAQAWLVLRLTGSPQALGTVVTLQFLPITLFTLFGGVLADRLPKLRVLKVTQTLSLLQAAVLGTLVATGTVELWHVYVLALFLGTVNALDGPVRQSFVVELVGRDQLVNAVALNSSIFNVARIIGPAVAGITIGVVGLSTAFYLNAVSYIGVLAAYFAMDLARLHAAQGGRGRGNVFKQVGEGLRYSWRTPPVLLIFILIGFIGTFGYNFTVIVPLVAEFVLKVGPGKFGILTSCMGFGSLASALLLAGLGRASSKVLWAGCVSFVLVFAAIAVSHSYAITCGLLVLLGFVGVAFSTTLNTNLQIMVPDELRGRVMSIFFLLFAGSTPIGGYLTGALSEVIGVPHTLLVEAALCGVGVAVAAGYRLAQRGAFSHVATKAGLEAEVA